MLKKFYSLEERLSILNDYLKQPEIYQIADVNIQDDNLYIEENNTEKELFLNYINDLTDDTSYIFKKINNYVYIKQNYDRNNMYLIKLYNSDSFFKNNAKYTYLISSLFIKNNIVNIVFPLINIKTDYKNINNIFDINKNYGISVYKYDINIIPFKEFIINSDKNTINLCITQIVNILKIINKKYPKLVCNNFNISKLYVEKINNSNINVLLHDFSDTREENDSNKKDLYMFLEDLIKIFPNDKNINFLLKNKKLNFDEIIMYTNKNNYVYGKRHNLHDNKTLNRIMHLTHKMSGGSAFEDIRTPDNIRIMDSPPPSLPSETKGKGKGNGKGKDKSQPIINIPQSSSQEIYKPDPYTMDFVPNGMMSMKTLPNTNNDIPIIEQKIYNPQQLQPPKQEQQYPLFVPYQHYPGMNVPTMTPPQKNYAINISNPISGLETLTKIYEDTLPDNISKKKYGYKTVFDRNENSVFFKNIINSTSINDKLDGTNALLSHIKFDDYDSSMDYLRNTPYGLLKYTCTFPIKLSSNYVSLEKNTDNINMNIRIYQLDKTSSKNVNRELQYYLWCNEFILHKRVSPNFVMIIVDKYTENTTIDWNRINIMKNMHFPSEEFDESSKVIVTESYNCSLNNATNPMYRNSGSKFLYTMSNTNHFDEQVWKSVIFQILHIFQVLYNNNIYFKNIGKNNFHVRYIPISNNIETWIYEINRIQYYVPNYGNIVLFDSTFNTGNPDDIHISSNILYDLDNFITNDAECLERLKIGLIDVLSCIRQIPLINDILSDLTASSSFTELIYKHFSEYLHNRCGTLILKTEKDFVSEISVLNITRQDVGKLFVYEEAYNVFKWVILKSVNGPHNIYNSYFIGNRTIDIHNGQIYEYTINDISPTIVVNDYAYNQNNVLEKYIVKDTDII